MTWTFSSAPLVCVHATCVIHTWRGLRNDADSPIASSMYFLSSAVMVGWAAGLSYDTRTQNKYQNIPKLPGRGRRRKQEVAGKKNKDVL